MYKDNRTRIEFDKLPEIAAPKMPITGTIKKLQTMLNIDAIDNFVIFINEFN